MPRRPARAGSASQLPLPEQQSAEHTPNSSEATAGVVQSGVVRDRGSAPPLSVEDVDFSSDDEAGDDLFNNAIQAIGDSLLEDAAVGSRSDDDDDDDPEAGTSDLEAEGGELLCCTCASSLRVNSPLLLLSSFR